MAKWSVPEEQIILQTFVQIFAQKYVVLKYRKHLHITNRFRKKYRIFAEIYAVKKYRKYFRNKNNVCFSETAMRLIIISLKDLSSQESAWYLL